MAVTNSTARYPGDSIKTLHLKRDREFGEITIQDYRGVMREGGLRVGSFLPGEIECSPGDTPKTWPEKAQYVHTEEEALVLFEAYVKEALADGWLERMLG